MRWSGHGRRGMEGTCYNLHVVGPTGKSDDVRTTVSVKTLTVSSVEELNTRSMSLSACPCDLLVTVGSHEQQSISRRAPPPGRHFWSRARMGLWSGVRARFDTVSITVYRSLNAVTHGKSGLLPRTTAVRERCTVVDTVSMRARTPLHSPIRARDQKCLPGGGARRADLLWS